jgi:hypothetical protein
MREERQTLLSGHELAKAAIKQGIDQVWREKILMCISYIVLLE